MNRVNRLWVPRYKEMIRNKMADLLAKRGAATPMVDPECYCGVPFSQRDGFCMGS